MWYSKFLKTSLRKHNLRVDLRVYLGDELEQTDARDIQGKSKSILSSAIVKGLDIIGIVSRFGIEVGHLVKQQAENNRIDLKVIPGQDYKSSDGVSVVFFGVQQNIQPGMTLQAAIKQCHGMGGRAMVYDLSKSVSRAISGWKGTDSAPDLVEIYNAHSKAFKDFNVDYPRVISSAARSGTELENIPVYSEIPRRQFQELGFLAEEEGSDYAPRYLEGD